MRKSSKPGLILAPVGVSRRSRKPDYGVGVFLRRGGVACPVSNQARRLDEKRRARLPRIERCMYHI